MFKRIIYIFICLALTSEFNLTTENLGGSAYAQSDDNELFLVGQKAFEDGFYDIAIRYLDQLLEQYPQTIKKVQANLLLGQCYFFKNQYLKAYDIFQNLTQYNELQDATTFWLGETYLKGSDNNKAQEQYLKLIKLYPESVYAPQAYYSLGWLYFGQNKLKEAIEVFNNILEKYPNHSLSEDADFKIGEAEYNLHNFEGAIKNFTNFISKYEKSPRLAEALFYLGETYYYQDDFINAVTFYAKAAESAYDSKLALMSKVSLGWCYLKLEKYPLAQKYFDESLTLAKEKGLMTDDVYLGQANLFSETKEYNKALDAYTKLIETSPASRRLFEAYLGKANIHYQLQDYKKAIETYKSLTAALEQNSAKEDMANINETIEKAYFGLAWSYLKNGEVEPAIKMFYEIKDRADNQTVKISALSQIGDAYQDSGQLDKAIEIYDKLLSDFPDSMYTDYIQYRQAIALLKLDRIDAATLSFQSLQTNFPKSKYLNDVKYYLAVAYFKKSDWATAKEQIEEFIKELPPNNEFLPEANHILALSSFNLQDYKTALKTFKNITQNFPNNTGLLYNAELNIAKCFYKIGDVAEALKHFEYITQKYTKTDIAQEALIWIGDHYLDSSDFDKAVTYYSRFIEQFPGSDKIDIVYYELGQAYKAKNELDKAVNAFKHITDPKNRELFAKAKLAVADIFSKDLDPQAAIETYQNIITSSPQFEKDAYLKIAEVYKNQLKDYSKSLESYQKALTSKISASAIKNSEIQFLIADNYELLNQPEKAIDEYMKIPYLYSSEEKIVIKAYLRIGRISEDKERWEEAQKIYSKIIEIKSEESKFAQERIDFINANILKPISK